MTTAPVRKGRNGLPPVTHSKRGHEYTPENTYNKPDGTRACHICRRASRAAWRQAGASSPVYLDGSPWLDFAAAIVRQSLDDYRNTGDDDARDFLVYCGLCDRNGYIRRH